jgi:hypothetical protein
MTFIQTFLDHSLASRGPQLREIFTAPTPTTAISNSSDLFRHFIFVACHILLYEQQLQVLILAESRCDVPRQSYEGVRLGAEQGR